MLDHVVPVYAGDNGEQHHAQALAFPVPPLDAFGREGPLRVARGPLDELLA